MHITDPNRSCCGNCPSARAALSDSLVVLEMKVFGVFCFLRLPALEWLKQELLSKMSWRHVKCIAPSSVYQRSNSRCGSELHGSVLSSIFNNALLASSVGRHIVGSICVRIILCSSCKISIPGSWLSLAQLMQNTWDKPVNRCCSLLFDCCSSSWDTFLENKARTLP